VNITTAPLDALPQDCRVLIARERVDSRDIFLRHKTTRRQLYDDTLRRVAAIPGCFDALFLNERDELAEGARSSVFIVKDGKWFTPPLQAGVLPGVMRRVQLARTDIDVSEKPLAIADLANADAIYLANALRGVVRCTLDTDTAV